jgi:AcrR family transcriptional regulator
MRADDPPGSPGEDSQMARAVSGRKNSQPKSGRGAKVAASTLAQPTKKSRRRDSDVVEAAAKVFYQKGYPDATVQDIADELGILKGSLYHYVDTKEDLLFQLIEQVHSEVQRILDEIRAEEDLKPLERLALYVRRQVEYNLDNLQRISIYYQDLESLTGARLEAIIASRKVHEKYLSDLIAKAQDTGEADNEGDPRLIAYCIFGTIIWPYRWFKPGKSSRKATVEVCVNYALSGVIG